MGAATVVSLADELTISAAAQQHARLLQAVQEAGAGELALDLGHVEACDSAGVQLLLATRASALARGMPLHITAASAPVRQALATFGMGDGVRSCLLPPHPATASPCEVGGGQKARPDPMPDPIPGSPS